MATDDTLDRLFDKIGGGQIAISRESWAGSQWIVARWTGGPRGTVQAEAETLGDAIAALWLKVADES